jgi:hypothetical protein
MSDPIRFKAYLRAALPDEYPVDGVPLSLKMGDAQRKEILFQQGKLLEMAEAQLSAAPWLTYLAALKHDQLFEAFGIGSTVFHELQDKEYFSTVEAVSRRLLSNSDPGLDEETKQHLRRLVAIQVYFSDISACQTVVENALAQGITAFEPPMEEIGQMAGCRGCLSIIGASILTTLVLGWIDRDARGFGLLILVVGGFIWGRKMSPIWEKEKEYKERMKAFNKLRDQYYLHANRFETDLGWDSREGAKDLAQAAEFLKSLQSERIQLQDHYIEPYL